MSVLHWWAMAIGAAAVALPLAIHLLTRPRPVRMPLSTLKFVREAVRQRRAVHRLRDFIILSLRTLALLLLAMALARPQWGEQPPISERDSGRAIRVVILDVSQSMAATERGIEALERARTVAARYLRYHPGLEANLIFAGASPRPVFERPSTNFEALRDELSRCQALPERLDVNRALDLAAQMLASRRAIDLRDFELVVVSDFQRSNWAAANFGLLPEKTDIQLESISPPLAPPNVAVLKTECRVQTSLGRSVRLAVEVGNFSPVPREVTVEAQLGDRAYRLSGTCPARGRTTLTEEILRPRQEGWLSGQARLLGAEDALTADNSRSLALEIRPKPVYALVTRQSAAERPSSSHFLECALVPDIHLGENSSAALVRIDANRLDHQGLAPAAVILLDHPGKLSEEQVGVVAGLMRRGRPVVYVAAEPIDATNLKRLSAIAGAGLQMPVEFLPPPSGQTRKDLFLASVRKDDPPFSVFGDHLAAVTRQLRFAGGLSSRRVEGGLADDLLASYGDGTASVVLTASDAGALAVLNADLSASRLPKTPAFVPILQELIGRMLDRGADRSAVCGEPLVAQLPGEIETTQGLRIVGPAASETADACGELTDERSGVVWQWSNPTPPGVYQVQRGDATVFALPVGLAAEESELEPISPEVLRERLAGGRKVHFRAAAGEEDQRDDAWTWFLTACVVAMLAEITAMLGFRT